MSADEETGVMQMWSRSHRADVDVLPLADRHYNRQKVGSPQFVPPGRCLVLKADGAVWVTSWPFAEYTKHAWAGAFVNSLFRKECDGFASEFIVAACAATRAEWPEIPAQGMVTFIDPIHVASRKVRGRLCIGISYFKAGFVHVGYTKGGLWAMQLTPERFPAAAPAFTDAPLFDAQARVKSATAPVPFRKVALGLTGTEPTADTRHRPLTLTGDRVEKVGE